MHILLTRPLEDCSEMILRFKSLGHQVSHLPLLNVEKLNFVGLQNCGHLPHVDLPSLSGKIIQDYFLD